MSNISRIDLSHEEFRHWFDILWFETEDKLRSRLVTDGLNNVIDTSDAVAFADCWSNKQSIEYGKTDCCGKIYLLKDAPISVIAHEALHMSLGILSREGNKTLTVTADVATPLEDSLCELMEFITREIGELAAPPQAEKGKN